VVCLEGVGVLNLSSSSLHNAIEGSRSQEEIDTLTDAIEELL